MNAQQTSKITSAKGNLVIYAGQLCLVLLRTKHVLRLKYINKDIEFCCPPYSAMLSEVEETANEN